MFSSMWIEVGFQLEPQLMFRCMVVNIKQGFMVVSLSEGLLPKIDSIAAPTRCCNVSTNLSPPNAQSNQQPRGFQDSLLRQTDTLQLLIYHIWT
jgi:hypothetical protein